MLANAFAQLQPQAAIGSLRSNHDPNTIVGATLAFVGRRQKLSQRNLYARGVDGRLSDPLHQFIA